jgi:Co/Zn/Cd efflux system component
MAHLRKLRKSLIAIAADLSLVGLKGVLAALTGSLALAADALHSLADLLVSLAALFGQMIGLHLLLPWPFERVELLDAGHLVDDNIKPGMHYRLP